MNIDNFKFTSDHDWVNAEGGAAYIGVTDFAQNSLGDIVFVDLPEVGAEINRGEVFSSVESVKAVADLKAPVSGKVTEVNDALGDEPQLVNEAPYENWIVKIELSAPDELDKLMDIAEYKELCDKEG